MSVEITCPRCSHEFDLLLARNDDDWRTLMQLMLGLPPVTHRSVWSYLSLFRGKNKLRSSKMLAIVKQLQPMIKAAQVERNGNTYSVTPDTFARAMQYMVETPPASLVLPIKNNNYLLSVLANNAETALQKAEQTSQQKKAGRYRDYTDTEVHPRNTTPAPAPAVKPEKKPKASSTMPASFKKLAGGLSTTLRTKHSTDSNNDNNQDDNHEQSEEKTGNA